jgi:hypothetical protein
MSDEPCARRRVPGTNGHGGGSVVPAGVWVDDPDEDDPALRQADGTLVDTWREEYPYAERLSREEYDHVQRLLQVELLKLQYWVRDSSASGTRPSSAKRPSSSGCWWTKASR